MQDGAVVHPAISILRIFGYRRAGKQAGGRVSGQGEVRTGAGLWAALFPAAEPAVHPTPVLGAAKLATEHCRHSNAKLQSTNNRTPLGVPSQPSQRGPWVHSLLS